MKSQMIKSRRYLECDCYSPDHLLVVDILEDDEQPDDSEKYYLAEFAFLSNWRNSWYKRIYYAIKYILGLNSYYISDSVCISERNIEQLEELVKVFKKNKSKAYN